MSTPWTRLGNLLKFGRAELATTELGVAAFDGDERAVRKALMRGIDWEAEQDLPLQAALLGRQWNIARLLLDGGIPATDATYRLVFDYRPELLSALPPRPELIDELRQEADWRAFIGAVFEGDLARARQLLTPHVEARIDRRQLFTYGIGSAAAIHYAARRAHLPLLRLVVRAGADVSALLEGRSPLRLVAECPGVTRSERRAAFRFLEAEGAPMAPPVRSWARRQLVRLGAWLPPGSNPPSAR